jgi:citryl-CoA lyase
MTEWTTDISDDGENAVIRGKALEDVMDMEFADAIWLLLTGDGPSQEESTMFNTILSCCIDHGIGNPSTVASRTIQSGGNPLNASVAGGILSLGEFHGGAIEGCMEMLTTDRTATEIVERHLEQEERIPGLGHKVYDETDTRAAKILNTARELGLAGEHVRLMEAVRDRFAERKADLPLNVDGAIAAVASDMGLEPELGKGLFIIARTPGIVAHVREEMDEDPFRRQEGEYTGK